MTTADPFLVFGSPLIEQAELNPGAEVIATPLTFCASINAIIHVNHARVARTMRAT